MASFVDICNQALSHLGDSATVASINPPEGSAQAEHCARFLPISLATMLEMHNWSFATQRVTLAEVTNPSTTWGYAYAKPSEALRIIGVLSPEATDDQGSAASYSPRDFALERDSVGNVIILTNQELAVARCVMNVKDPVKFNPLFVEALGWLLASKLAGPIVKGETGLQAGRAADKAFRVWFASAVAADAGQDVKHFTHQVPWLANR